MMAWPTSDQEPKRHSWPLVPSFAVGGCLATVNAVFLARRFAVLTDVFGSTGDRRRGAHAQAWHAPIKHVCTPPARRHRLRAARPEALQKVPLEDRRVLRPLAVRWGVGRRIENGDSRRT